MAEPSSEEMVGETMAGEETHIRLLWAPDEWATEENHTDFKAFLCVEPEMFFELVDRVGPRIQKNTR